MIIYYYTKSQYGQKRHYLADPDIARIVEELTGLKTLIPKHMTALEDLGFTFVEVQD